MAGAKVRGITIELSADASGINSALQSTNKSINSTARELRDIEKLLKLDPSNVTLLAQKHEALQRQVTQTKDKLDLLKDAEKDLKDQMKDGGTDEQKKQLAALQREIISTKQDLNKLEDQMDDTGDEAKDLAKAEEETKDATKDMGDGFSVLKGAMASLVADGIRMVVDGFKDLMTSGPQFADDILTLSSQTGVATDTLQELSYAAGLVDVDVSTVASSLKKLTKQMSSAKDGSGSAADAFDTLGVSVTDVNGNLRDNEDVFKDVIDALGDVENETERDALAMEIFGKSATDLNPLIEAGSDALDAFADEAQEMGYVLDEDALEALGRVQDEFDRFQNQMTAVKNQIAAGVAPAIEKGMKKIQEVIQKIDWKAVGEKMGNAFNALIDAFSWIVDHGGGVKAIISGVITAMAASKVVAFASALTTMTTATEAATGAQEGLNVAMSANPVILLIEGIVAAGVALLTWQKSVLDAKDAADPYRQELESLNETFDSHIQAVEDSCAKYDELKEARENTIESGTAQLDQVQSLTDELSTLVDENGEVAESDKARAQFILNELNNALGTEYTMTGNVIDQYEDLEQAVKDCIAQKKAEIVLQAQEDAYREAIVNRADAERELEQIVYDRAVAEGELTEAHKRQAEVLDEVAEGNMEHMTELPGLSEKISGLEDKVNELSDAYDDQAELVDQYSYDVQTYTDNMTAALEGDYDSIEYKSWETAKAQGEASTEASEAVKENALSASSTWLTSISDTLTEMTGKQYEFKDAGEGMVQAYIDGEEAGSPIAIETMAVMCQDIVNGSDISEEMKTSGYNAVMGLTNGINWNSTIATNAARNLAQDVINTFRSTMDEGSPSKVMAESGKNIVLGLAKGIEKNAKTAVNATSKLGDSVQKSMNTVVSGTGGYNAVVSGGSIVISGMQTTTETSILTLLSRYLPQLADMDVTLDSDAIVGKLAPKYNKQLGKIETLTARGV